MSASPAAPARPGGRIYYGWYIVAAALATNGMSACLQGYSTGVFFVPMSDDLGWTRTEFIVALTISQFVMAIVGALIGGLIDRHGGRMLMLAGALVTSAALLATAEVDELWQWRVLRGVAQAVGVGLGGLLVANVVLSKWFVRYRGRALGIAVTGLSLAGVLTPTLLTPVVDDYGWRAGWRVLAVATALLMISAALVMRRQPEDHGLLPDGRAAEDPEAGEEAERARLDYDTSLTRRQAIRSTALWLLVAAFGLGGLSFTALGAQTIPFLTDSGFSRTTAAGMLSLFALPGLLTRAFWGVLAERIQPRLLAAAAFLATAAAMAIIIPAARSGSTALVALGFLTFGCGIAGFVPIQEVIWASFFGRRYLGGVRGVAMPFQLVFSAAGPFVVSLYFDAFASYDGVFAALALCALLATVLVLAAPMPRARRAPPRTREREVGRAPPEPALPGLAAAAAVGAHPPPAPGADARGTDPRPPAPAAPGRAPAPPPRRARSAAPLLAAAAGCAALLLLAAAIRRRRRAGRVDARDRRS
ncbi:MAG: MFS transporter [Chloroflexi bacterium]|nr:MFS transporter [Chloroflexota bacterium]